jgi:D-glycero-alpha-D-manno-heptose-7-phosphate kinase
MIIIRTPFRISFFGGGTDYPVWYNEHGGSVISTSIDKYCYITCRYLPPFFDYKYRIRYYRKEEVSHLDEIQHPAVRECIRFMNVSEGIEMVHHADLPARSGLGSSSTFTVGMLHALYTLKNLMPTKRELALNAIRVEQDMIKECVGSQDQTIAAFGGFNKIDFGGPQHIQVTPLIVNAQKLKNLNERLMLFFTGFSRNAHEMAEIQVKNTPDKKVQLKNMIDICDHAYDLFSHDSDCPRRIGELLHEQWQVKKEMSNVVSNNDIDDIYDRALRAGAVGGKLLGAGGGGFILLYVEPEKQQNVRDELKKLLHVPFYFEHLGSQVIYFSK